MKLDEMRRVLENGNHTVELWGPASKSRERYACSRDPKLVDCTLLEAASERESSGDCLAAVSTENGKLLLFKAGFIVGLDGRNTEERASF